MSVLGDQSFGGELELMDLDETGRRVVAADHEGVVGGVDEVDFIARSVERDGFRRRFFERSAVSTSCVPRIRGGVEVVNLALDSAEAGRRDRAEGRGAEKGAAGGRLADDIS